MLYTLKTRLSSRFDDEAISAAPHRFDRNVSIAQYSTQTRHRHIHRSRIRGAGICSTEVLYDGAPIDHASGKAAEQLPQKPLRTGEHQCRAHSHDHVAETGLIGVRQPSAARQHLGTRKGNAQIIVRGEEKGVFHAIGRAVREEMRQNVRLAQYRSDQGEGSDNDAIRGERSEIGSPCVDIDGVPT